MCWPGSCWLGRLGGLADSTIASDVVHLEQVRVWFGRPLREMEPADADAYFGKALRDAANGTRLAGYCLIVTRGCSCAIGP